MKFLEIVLLYTILVVKFECKFDKSIQYKNIRPYIQSVLNVSVRHQFEYDTFYMPSLYDFIHPPPSKCADTTISAYHFITSNFGPDN